MTNADYDNSYKRVSLSQENALPVQFPNRDKSVRGTGSTGQGQAPSIRSAAPMCVGNDIPYTRSPGLYAGIPHSSTAHPYPCGRLNIIAGLKPAAFVVRSPRADYDTLRRLRIRMAHDYSCL